MEVTTVSEAVADVARIRELVQEHGADVLEAVLPLPLLAQAVDPRNGVGVPAIRAVMDRVLLNDGGAEFRFRYYERVVRVLVETEPL